MNLLLAVAEPAYLLHPVKPVLMAIALVGWAWCVGFLDKDAAYFYLHRYYWNMAQLGCGIIGFAMMLLIPIFAIGFILGLIILVSGMGGYAYYRNAKVPSGDRWAFSIDSFKQKIVDAEYERAQKKASMVLLKSDEGRIDIPSGDTPAAAGHAILEQVMDFALLRNADKIDLHVEAQQARLSARIDGVKYAQPSPEPKVALALIDYLKSAADLDLEDRRKRQVGELLLDTEDYGRHTFELITSGSTRGLSMILEIDTHLRAKMPLTKLGLLEAQKEQLIQLIDMSSHVVLIAAPPREGGTTTTFSLLNEHDPYTDSVITLEDAKGFELEGVNHNQLPEGTTAVEFNERLGQIIRSDPQVVMLSRLVNAESATLCAKNADHVRFYVPLPTYDTFSALKTWTKAVGDPRLASHALGAIIAQRLIRKLCTTCKTSYTPDAEALRKLNIPADKAQQFFAASGKVVVKDKPQPCPNCHGLGYKGRTGVFELMVLDQAARQFVATKDEDGLRGYLRKSRMLYLQEAALAKVVDGTTDIKEISRAITEQKKK